MRRYDAASAFVIQSAMRVTSRRILRLMGSRAQTPDAAAPLVRATRDSRAILVVALAEIGDMVLLSPFVRELRRLAPDARITLVTLPRGASLFSVCDEVDEVLIYDARAPRLLKPFILPGIARKFAQRHFRSRQFDLALIPRWDTDQNLATALALFSGALRRVGYSETVNPRKRVLNAGFDSLLTDVLPGEGNGHEVERHLAFIRALGGDPSSDLLELWLSGPDREMATELLPQRGRSIGGPIVALGIGAAHPKRRWPLSRFAEVGRTLQNDWGAHIVVVGGDTDQEAQAELLNDLGPAVSGFAGLLTLRQTAAVLESCQLFIGNDSGPLHLAVASGLPVVEISCHPKGGAPSDPNAPERFGPWRVPSMVLRPSNTAGSCRAGCTDAHAHCILGVSSESVIAACEGLVPRPAARASNGS